MALNPEQLLLSLSFLMNSSHASPKRLEAMSEANQSRIKLMIPAFSTEFAMFSTDFSLDPWSLLRGCGFSAFASIELDTMLDSSIEFQRIAA